jgi:hypothetical protein
MPGPAPKTDKWTARENKQGKLGIVLIVSGLVEVSNTNKHPVLKEASGGGGYGKTLVLDLTIETAGPGNDVQVWKRATLSKDVSAGHYDNVEIRWDGKAIATAKVTDDDEHHQHLTALTQAANKAHAKDKPPTPAKPKPSAAPKRPAPKRPAPKRAAPKKAAAKKKSSAAKKRKSAAVKKRAPAAKKRAAAVKKRRPASSKKRSASVKKRRSAAKKRRPAARKR